MPNPDEAITLTDLTPEQEQLAYALSDHLMEQLILFRMSMGKGDPDASAALITGLQHFAGMGTEMELGALQHCDGLPRPATAQLHETLIANHDAGMEEGSTRSRMAGEVVAQFRAGRGDG